MHVGSFLTLTFYADTVSTIPFLMISPKSSSEVEGELVELFESLPEFSTTAAGVVVGIIVEEEDMGSKALLLIEDNSVRGRLR